MFVAIVAEHGVENNAVSDTSKLLPKLPSAVWLETDSLLLVFTSFVLCRLPPANHGGVNKSRVEELETTIEGRLEIKEQRYNNIVPN